jgi:hypothetical protein
MCWEMFPEIYFMSQESYILHVKQSIVDADED